MLQGRPSLSLLPLPAPSLAALPDTLREDRSRHPGVGCPHPFTVLSSGPAPWLTLTPLVSEAYAWGVRPWLHPVRHRAGVLMLLRLVKRAP